MKKRTREMLLLVVLVSICGCASMGPNGPSVGQAIGAALGAVAAGAAQGFAAAMADAVGLPPPGAVAGVAVEQVQVLPLPDGAIIYPDGRIVYQGLECQSYANGIVYFPNFGYFYHPFYHWNEIYVGQPHYYIYNGRPLDFSHPPPPVRGFRGAWDGRPHPPPPGGPGGPAPRGPGGAPPVARNAPGMSGPGPGIGRPGGPGPGQRQMSGPRPNQPGPGQRQMSGPRPNQPGPGQRQMSGSRPPGPGGSPGRQPGNFQVRQGPGGGGPRPAAPQARPHQPNPQNRPAPPNGGGPRPGGGPPSRP